MYSFSDYVKECDETFPELGVKNMVLFADVDQVSLVKFMALKLFICTDSHRTTSNIAFKTRAVLEQIDSGMDIDWGY